MIGKGNKRIDGDHVDDGCDDEPVARKQVKRGPQEKEGKVDPGSSDGVFLDECAHFAPDPP
jgi:hypothetical protein